MDEAPLKHIDADAEHRKRIEYALKIWGQAVEFRGTIAETYLRHRHTEVSARVVDLRFHPRCVAGEGRRVPAMVALMRNIITNEPRAIHRTFIKSDGTGKDDLVGACPKGRKFLGPSEGAMIKLADDADVTLGLGIAEGVENALTWAAAGWWPIWAAPDVEHVKKFPVLDGIETLTIFADNKKADDVEAARECAIRWSAAGKRVEILKPREGTDWNDIGREIA